MGKVWGSTQNIRHYFSLKSRNDSLAAENHMLLLRIAELEAINEEAEIEVPADGIAGNFHYMPATIVKISNNTQHNYMIVGKGKVDGVNAGSGVITSKGAVGIIDAVGENYSYARSFKNHEMSISSRLGRTGTVAPLCWDGRSNSGAVLKEIPLHLEFEPGDTVYTSGHSSIFPPDIPLGVTGKAEIVNGSTFDIEVKLFEDFNALRYVTIVDNIGKEEIKALEEEQ